MSFVIGPLPVPRCRIYRPSGDTRPLPRPPANRTACVDVQQHIHEGFTGGVTGSTPNGVLNKPPCGAQEYDSGFLVGS